MKYLGFLLALFLVSCAGASQMLVYGGASSGGEPLPAGSLVVAKVADSVVGNGSVQGGGAYSAFVLADVGEYSPVEFFAGDMRAVQVVPFRGDVIMAIDLDFERFEKPAVSTTTVPAPALTGNALSVTVSDNLIGFAFLGLLLFIGYSIKDILELK